jgi:A/G-specific adenine glycosylase
VFDFNQALMDFGAMVCVARNPRCLVCPMTKSCRAYRRGLTTNDHRPTTSD